MKSVALAIVLSTYFAAMPCWAGSDMLFKLYELNDQSAILARLGEHQNISVVHLQKVDRQGTVDLGWGNGGVVVHPTKHSLPTWTEDKQCLLLVDDGEEGLISVIDADGKRMRPGPVLRNRPSRIDSPWPID